MEPMVSSALQDLLREDLKDDQRRVIVQELWNLWFHEGFTKGEMSRSKTLAAVKSLPEFFDLVKITIDDYEKRQGVVETARVTFTEEEPDAKAEHESITYSLVQRNPGSFSKGAPLEGKVHNLKPMIREVGSDPANPGYRQVVVGYWYDSVIRFTCWARTNKVANARAEWFMGLMEEYSWWFKAQGVDRVLFWEQQADLVTNVDGIKWYGRPIDYFVRTEKLRVFSEKALEQILLNFALVREV